jgi:hypothetical protein
VLLVQEKAMRIALVFLALAGCAASTGPSATADKAPPPTPAPPGTGDINWRMAVERVEAPFNVPGTVGARLNEEVQIGDLRVKPLEVVEDSRCADDVSCVWAGRIRLRVAVSGAGEPVMELDHPVTVAGGRRLTLVGVAPPNWVHPPAGVDPNAPKRFAFRLSGMD